MSVGGESHDAARATRLAEELGGLDADALLVDSLVNVRYLTGFTGSSALALVVGEATGARLGGHRFLSDFRYATQSAEQVPEEFEREIVTGELLDALAGVLADGGGRLGFDDASLTVKQYRKLEEQVGEGWELVPCAGAVERLREVKDAGEIGRIRAASELADEALRTVLEDGLVGRTERDVALELELRMRRLGAQAPTARCRTPRRASRRSHRTCS
jgi:Xaa-Pro aminopeptidase